MGEWTTVYTWQAHIRLQVVVDIAVVEAIVAGRGRGEGFLRREHQPVHVSAVVIGRRVARVVRRFRVHSGRETTATTTDGVGVDAAA